MAKPLSTRRRSGASSRGDGGEAGSPFPVRREELTSTVLETEAWRASCGRSRRRLKPRVFAEGRF